MMPNVGPMELGIVIVVALLVFGPKRLPELGRATGRGIREFRQSVSGADARAELAEGGVEAKGATERVAGATPGPAPTTDS